MHFIIQTLITLFICINNSNLMAQNLYSMTDLEVLRDRESFEEFFLHAKDIRPGERERPWITMVQHMSEKYLRHILKRPFVSHVDFKKVDDLAEWSVISENPGFMILRNKFGIRFFNYCFEHEVDKDKCYRDALNFIKRTPNEVQMATDIGEVIYKFRLKQSSDKLVIMNLWPFFENMAKNPISEFYCHKDFFRNEVMSQITRNISQLNLGDIKKRINKITHPDCWKKLSGYLKEKLNSDQQLQSINAYYLLAAKNELQAYDEQRFLIMYLLYYPSPDQIFGKSWKLLKTLAKNYELREKLILEIQSYDPIPGTIFKNHQDKRAIIIIKALSENFPEYIDLYSQTCLSYLEGKEFPNGNPTPECFMFFNIAKKYSLVPNSVLRRYSAAKEFKHLNL